jgi:hypothetical protein
VLKRNTVETQSGSTNTGAMNAQDGGGGGQADTTPQGESYNGMF